MIIDCISDVHGYYPDLEGGDLLIIAGDLTARDEPQQYKEFNQWIAELRVSYKEIVVIAGNHDGLLEKKEVSLKNCYYLEDSGCEVKGLKVWGSPWTPEFCDWHFMLPRKSAELKAKWDLIPTDTDILVTHGPAYGVLDIPHYESPVLGREFSHQGCELLRDAVERIMPKLHVFGHIHGSYGQLVLKHEGPNTICVNAAHCNEYYRPLNKPIRIEL